MNSRRTFLQGFATTLSTIFLGCNKPRLIETVTREGNTSWDNLAHGELDDIDSKLLYARLEAAPQIAAMFEFPSGCLRCKMPWQLVRTHCQDYERSAWSSRGICVLCEDCWVELYTLENRLPYFIAAMKKHNWENQDKVLEGLTRLSKENIK